MLTSQEVLQELLLDGRKVNKFTFLHESGSVCLAQRVLELRQAGWNIRSRAIKGKGALREYWLDREEIDRLNSKPTESVLPKDEVLVEENNNVAENEEKGVLEEEQLGLGLLGFSNYGN